MASTTRNNLLKLVSASSHSRNILEDQLYTLQSNIFILSVAQTSHMYLNYNFDAISYMSNCLSAALLELSSS